MSLENLPLPIQDTQPGGPGQITVTQNLRFISGLLDTAQAIQITSAPRFAGLTLGSLNGVAWLTSGTVGVLTLGDSLVTTSGVLNVRVGGSIIISNTVDTVQPIGTNDTPTFAALTIESLTLGTGPGAANGILAAIAGEVAPVELGQSLIFSTGFNRLDTIQALSTTAYPTFRGLTIGNTSGLAFLTAGVVSTVTLGANLSITDGVISAGGSGGSISLGPSLMYNISDQLDTRQPLRVSDAPTFSGLTLTGASGILYASGSVGTIGPGVTITIANNLINTIQDIRTSAAPTFAGLTLGTLSGLLSGASGVISAVTLGANLTLSGTLDTIQDIQTSSSPTFSGLTLGTGPGIFQGILAAVDGQVATVALSGLTFSSVFNTLSTVQDIRTSAAPTFAGLTLGSLSGLMRATSGVISTVTLGANLTLSGTLDTIQDIQTSSSPTFSGLTLGTGPGVFQGILTASAGVCTAQAPGSSLTLNSGVLNTIQDIRQTAAPTFSGLTLGGLSLGGYSGILYATAGAVAAAAVGANLDISTGTLTLAANISVSGATIGAASGLAWLAAGVVQAASLSGNLAYSGSVLDLADNIAVETLQVGTLSGILAANSGTVAAVTLGAGLSYAAGILNTAAAQTFSSLTLGASSGVLCRVSGVVQNVTLDTNLSFSAGTLSIAASPTFTNLTLSIADGLISSTNGLLTHVNLGSNLSLTAGTLNLAASPAVTSLTIGTLSGLLSGTSGVVSAVTLDPNLTLQSNILAINTAPTLAGLTLGTGPGVFQGILAAVDGQVAAVTLSGLTFNSAFNTLSTVQDIRTSAAPTFAGLTLTSLTLGTLSGVLCRVTGEVQNATLGTNLTFSAGTLSIAASPVFSGLTLGSLAGLLYASSGVVSAASLGTNLTFSAGTLSIAASPVFAGLTLGSLAGLLYGSAGVVSAASLGTNLSFTSGVLRVSSTPTFTSLTLGSSTALLYRDAGLITDVTLGTNLSLTAGQLSIAAVPVFSGLTLGTASGFLYASSGVVSAVTLGPNLALNAGVLDVAAAPVFAGLTIGIGIGAIDGILSAIGGQVAAVNLTGLTFSTVYNMLSTVQDIRTTASPTFASLTLSGLTADRLVYSNASNLLSSVTLSANLTLVSGTLNTVQNIQTTSAPTFAGLTLSGLASALLKVNGSGVVQAATANVDYQAALTAGTNITITSNTIATATIPTFAGINCVSIGNQNTLCGTSAGANLTSNGSGGNSFYGYQSGMSCTSGGLNLAFGNGALSGGTALTGQGYNTAFGISALSNLSGTAQHNIGLGYIAGFNLTTGSNCIYIGNQANASAGTVTNEGVINLAGSSVTGRGANTLLLNATAGVYFKSPATCFLYATNFSSGRCQWANFAANNPINGFTLSDYGNGSNTIIVPNQPGLYQIDVSGTVLGGGGSIFGTWNNTNVNNYNHFLQSFSTLGIAYQMNFSIQCRPYTVINLSGFELQITGATYYGGLPLFVSIRYISV